MMRKDGLANNLQGVPENTGSEDLLRTGTNLIVIRESTA